MRCRLRWGEAEGTNSSVPGRRRLCVRDRLPDALGIFWVLLAAGAALTPALAHGTSLGNYDLQTVYGGLATAGAKVRWQQATDQLTLFMPLSHLAWTQVHQGHLPLWNPYNALGIPLAFNWESATFSVPVVLGYLVPVHLAYTVQVVATYAIAGVGVYILGKVLRLGVIGCTMAATVYELSGPLFALVGWSFGGVMAWAGWLLAATILVLRGRHRLRAVVFLAVIVACAIYAGEPEALVFLAIAVVVVMVVVLGSRALRYGRPGPILRPLIDLAVAVLAGGALGAPLILPGLQVGGLSIRSFRGGECVITTCGRPRGLPLIDLVHVVFQGFDGLPVSGEPVVPTECPLYQHRGLRGRDRCGSRRARDRDAPAPTRGARLRRDRGRHDVARLRRSRFVLHGEPTVSFGPSAVVPGHHLHGLLPGRPGRGGNRRPGPLGHQ